MARSRKRKTPRSAEQLAASTSSRVAVAAFLRSGAGSHGKSGRRRNRSERQQSRRALRRGDWD